MWRHPGRLLHVIVLTLFGIWITSQTINNLWPIYSTQKSIERTDLDQKKF